MTLIEKVLVTLGISILPIVELRGAIPVGCAFGLPFYLNFILAVLGNLLPIPFILMFIPRFLDFLARFKLFRPMVSWLRRKADKNRDKVIKPEGEDGVEISESSARDTRKMSAATFIGLLFFVAIPLPATGAWTGALVASLFNLPKRKSFLAILLGVLLSGTVITLISYGVLGFLSFLL